MNGGMASGDETKGPNVRHFTQSDSETCCITSTLEPYFFEGPERYVHDIEQISQDVHVHIRDLLCKNM